jgi:hypothetical protein
MLISAEDCVYFKLIQIFYGSIWWIFVSKNFETFDNIQLILLKNKIIQEKFSLKCLFEHEKPYKRYITIVCYLKLTIERITVYLLELGGKFIFYTSV